MQGCFSLRNVNVDAVPLTWKTEVGTQRRKPLMFYSGSFFTDVSRHISLYHEGIRCWTPAVPNEEASVALFSPKLPVFWLARLIFREASAWAQIKGECGDGAAARSAGVPVQMALQKAAQGVGARRAINYHSVISENFGRKTGRWS